MNNTDFIYSIICIVPSENVDVANTLMVAHGECPPGGKPYIIELSETGEGSPSHYCLISPARIEHISIMMSSSPPDVNYQEFGLTDQEVEDTWNSRIISYMSKVTEDWISPYDHYSKLLTKQTEANLNSVPSGGLKRIVPEDIVN